MTPQNFERKSICDTDEHYEAKNYKSESTSLSSSLENGVAKLKLLQSLTEATASTKSSLQPPPASSFAVETPISTMSKLREAASQRLNEETPANSLKNILIDRCAVPVQNHERVAMTATAVSSSAMTNVTDDEYSLSSATATANATQFAKLLSEIAILKEKEKKHAEKEQAFSEKEQAFSEKEQSYLVKIRDLADENEKLSSVVIEFEGIFQNLVKDKEDSEAKLKNEILDLTKERDQLQEDVFGVEKAFDDLHRRFEKLKLKVEEFKKNEDSLQKAIDAYKQNLEKEKLRYSTLKKHAEERIEFANTEIEKLRKNTSIDLQTLRAELRKAEIKISSLELSMQQKDQENSQLTSLLEEVLSKVKHN